MQLFLSRHLDTEGFEYLTSHTRPVLHSRTNEFRDVVMNSAELDVCARASYRPREKVIPNSSDGVIGV